MPTRPLLLAAAGCLLVACSGERVDTSNRAEWYADHYQVAGSQPMGTNTPRDPVSTMPVFNIHLNESTMTIDDTTYQAMVSNVDGRATVDLTEYGDNDDFHIEQRDDGVYLINDHTGAEVLLQRVAPTEDAE